MRRIRTLPGGTNDNDAHDAHAGEPNFITVQNKIIAKILPVNKFTTLKFLSLLHSMRGLVMFCSAIHVYTDRSADTGIVIRPPWLRCEFPPELPLVLIFWSFSGYFKTKGAGQFYQ